MIKLIKFVMWKWSNSDEIEKIVLLFIPVVIIAVCLLPFVGIIAFMLIPISILGIIGIHVLWGLWSIVRSQWMLFNEENPDEDVKIINRLKGSGPGSHESNK